MPNRVIIISLWHLVALMLNLRRRQKRDSEHTAGTFRRIFFHLIFIKYPKLKIKTNFRAPSIHSVFSKMKKEKSKLKSTFVIFQLKKHHS